MATRSAERRRKAWIDAYKGSVGCLECGFSDPRALDLHHRDPEDKHPRLKKKDLVSLPFSEIVAEIEKCDVLCANCHRLSHAGAVVLPMWIAA